MCVGHARGRGGNLFGNSPPVWTYYQNCQFGTITPIDQELWGRAALQFFHMNDEWQIERWRWPLAWVIFHDKGVRPPGIKRCFEIISLMQYEQKFRNLFLLNRLNHNDKVIWAPNVVTIRKLYFSELHNWRLIIGQLEKQAIKLAAGALFVDRTHL